MRVAYHIAERFQIGLLACHEQTVAPQRCDCNRLLFKSTASLGHDRKMRSRTGSSSIMEPVEETALHPTSTWARTGDEDVHQSPGTLLPVRAGGHVGDADKSSQ